eukprot:1387931-Pyramimonas_sp.AAC.1
MAAQMAARMALLAPSDGEAVRAALDAMFDRVFLGSFDSVTARPTGDAGGAGAPRRAAGPNPDGT